MTGESDIRIHKMAEADLDEVIALGLATPEIQTGTESPQFYYRETLERWIESPNGILLVAKVEGNLAGFRIADYNPYSRDGHLHVTIVKNEYRGQGVGRKLLNVTLGELESLGCNHVYCEVEEDNEVVLEFFRKNNFDIGRRFYRVERTLPRYPHSSGY